MAIIGSTMDIMIRVAGMCLALITSDCVKYIEVLLEQCTDIFAESRGRNQANQIQRQ